MKVSLRNLLVLLVVLLFCGAGCFSSNEGDGSMAANGRTEDCSWLGDQQVTLVDDMDERLAAYAQVPLGVDLSILDDTQRSVLSKLREAGVIMNDLFRIQACPCREELLGRLNQLPADKLAGAARYFEINVGPWDRLNHFEPFMDDWTHPEGANYYPLDLTEAEREQISADPEGLGSLLTMVRRDATGKLVAIPYSEFFAPELERAAALLREAAALTENASLKTFLESRAASFLSDDYYQSDMDWMDLDSPVEITIGPYETYEDGLFGYKAAFEAFVTIVDPAASEQLAIFKSELPWLENNLPIPDNYKNPNRGSESPIRVADEVYTGGDTRAGVQTLAFNLPNDERVREAKGSKKVLLRNAMNAKFSKILVPLAEKLLEPALLPNVTAECFFMHTLFHEMGHGLGPGRIVIDGRQTEVRLELKETYSTIEEAKADALGEWIVFKMQGKGYFPESVYREQAATYLAGLFRSVRFGISEAHGQANAIQFNYLFEKGVISHDAATGLFDIDADALPAAAEELVREICILQAEGDYAAATSMIEKYAFMPQIMSEGLERLVSIPVDIEPIFADDPTH